MWRNLILQTSKEVDDVLWLARPREAAKFDKLLISSSQSLHLRRTVHCQAKEFRKVTLLLGRPGTTENLEWG